MDWTERGRSVGKPSELTLRTWLSGRCPEIPSPVGSPLHYMALEIPEPWESTVTGCTNGSRVKLCTTRNIYSFRYLLRRQSAVTSCRCFSMIRSSAPMSDKNGDQGGICWCRDEKPGRDPSRSRMRIMSCRGRICADLEIRISTSANHFSVMLLVPIG